MSTASSVLAMMLLWWSPEVVDAPVSAAATRHGAGAIAGVVRDTSRQPLRQALVLAHCFCLQRPREVQTDDLGRYFLEGLPIGSYTVQVLFGPADVSQDVMLEGPRRALDFRVDTRAGSRRQVRAHRRGDEPHGRRVRGATVLSPPLP